VVSTCMKFPHQADLPRLVTTFAGLIPAFSDTG
jgi:hypothetical protein